MISDFILVGSFPQQTKSYTRRAVSVPSIPNDSKSTRELVKPKKEPYSCPLITLNLGIGSVALGVFRVLDPAR